MSDLTIPHSYMVSVEVVGPEGLDPDAVASEIENEVGQEIECYAPSGNCVLLEIGAVADCDSLLDDGVKFRAGSVIPPGRDVLIWCDPAGDGDWGARVSSFDVWPAVRFPTAEMAIKGRDTLRDLEREHVETPARKLIEAQCRIAGTVLENRAAIELAVSLLENSIDTQEAADDLREILAGLDGWHDQSIDELKAAYAGDGDGKPEDTDSLEDHGKELGSYTT